MEDLNRDKVHYIFILDYSTLSLSSLCLYMLCVYMEPVIKMRGKQLYFTEELCKMLDKKYGEGKVSSNVEVILRAYLSNPLEERKIRWKELVQSLSYFNSDFKEDLIITERENVKEVSPPPPPPEENSLVRAAGLIIKKASS